MMHQTTTSSVQDNSSPHQQKSHSSLKRAEFNKSKIKKELRKTVFKGIGMQNATKNAPHGNNFIASFKNQRYMGGGFGMINHTQSLEDAGESIAQETSSHFAYDTIQKQQTVDIHNQSKESLMIQGSPSVKVFDEFYKGGTMKNQAHTTNHLPKGAVGNKLFINTDNINQTSSNGETVIPNGFAQVQLPPLIRPSQIGQGMASSERMGSQSSPFTPSESGASSAHNRLNQLMQYYGSGGIPAHMNSLVSTNPFSKKMEAVSKLDKSNRKELPTLKKDWAEALKREIQNQSSSEQDSSQKINFSRFMKSPLIGSMATSNKLIQQPLSPFYPKQQSKMFPSTNVDSGSVSALNTEPGTSGQDFDTLSSLRQNQSQNPNANTSLPLSQHQQLIDQISKKHFDTSPHISNKANVHHLLHEELVQDNKFEEIEKIMMKKLIENQQQQIQQQQMPQTRASQFQKPRLHKSKMGTEKLIKMQRFQVQKDEYERERMMQSVQYLFEQTSSSVGPNLNNTASNNNMLSGILLHQSPDSRLSQMGGYQRSSIKPLFPNKDYLSSYKASSASKPKLFHYQSPQEQSLINMRKTLLEQTPSLQAVGQELIPLKSQSVMASGGPTAQESRQTLYSESLRKKHQQQLRRSIDKGDDQQSNKANLPDFKMSVIYEEHQENTGAAAAGIYNDAFGKKVEEQSNQFSQAVETIVKDSTFMRGYQEVESGKKNATQVYKADFDQKIANIDNHFDIYMTSLGDQMLTETKKHHEEYENSKVYNPHSKLNIHPNRYLRKKVVGGKFPKDAFSFGKAKILSPKESNSKEIQFNKKLSSPGTDSDPDIHGDDDGLTDRKQHYYEQLKKRQLELREAGSFSSQEFSSSKDTRNLYFSSSKSSEILNTLGLDRNDLVNLQNTLMRNLRQMQQEFASHSDTLGFTRDELSTIVNQMIEQQLVEALQDHKSSLKKGIYSDRSSFIETQRTVTTVNENDPSKNLECYQKIMYQTFSRVAQEIKGSLQFAQMNKNAFQPEYQFRLEDDPKYRYAMECRTQSVSVLPLLQRIKNRVLNLASYTLNSGLAKSFGQSIKKSDTTLNRIILENNHLKDEDFAAMCEGLHKLQDIKSIIYIKNEFGFKSAEAMKILVGNRFIPYHLEELRLVNCKISPQVINNFLEILESRNYLKRLALVNASINEQNMKKLIPFIRSSRYLIELDLSWNGFRTKNLLEFFDAIGDNKQLQHLNLSWNNLIDKSDMTHLRGGAIAGEFKPEDEIKELMAKVVEKAQKLIPPPVSEEGLPPPKQQTGSPLEGNELQLFIMAKITKFMKYNKNLVHLDLSNTGLNEQMIRTIATALKRSKSILSLHLSGNPGVTNQTKDFLFERVRCCRPRPDLFSDSDLTPESSSNNSYKLVNNQALNQMALNTLDKVVHKTFEKTSQANQVVREGVEFTQVTKQKKLATMQVDGMGDPRGHGNVDLANESHCKLIFQRWVGHKQDMPGSGQWQMLTDMNDACWVCDKWIYGLIFWNPKISNQTQIDIDFFEKTKILEQIGIINKNNNFNTNQSSAVSPKQNLQTQEQTNLPQIVGSFTNWQYRQMMTLDDYINHIDKTPSEELVKQLKINYLCRNEAKNEADLNEEEMEQFKLVQEAHKKRRKKYWRLSLAQSLKYNKRPFLVNYDKLPKIPVAYTPRRKPKPPKRRKSSGSSNSYSPISSEEEVKEVDNSMHTWIWDPNPPKIWKRNKVPELKEDDIWVIPVFMRSGKHSYFVKEGLSDQHFAHKVLAPFREEDIPIQVKQSRTKTVQRVFKKDTSVFRDWKEDNAYIMSKSAELDKKEWKAPRFIRDPEEVDRCWDIIWQNFAKLKDIFISMASRSNFPSVTNFDFSTFCDQCKLIDGKTFNMADIDRLFIATNVEIVANDENPDKELCRFEFFEILLRISDFKYRQKGTCATFYEALEKVINENVFPNYKPAPWQEFRDRDLYTVEVNDVLEANLSGLKKVYEYFFDPRKKYMSMQDALDLMIKMTPLALTEKDAFFCYGMSKMTVINEAEESSIKYKRLQFVELLEMIGRIADVKYKGTEMETTMTLAQRIEFVLDDVLSLVEVKRKDVNIVIDEQSESDDEY